jgi:Uma2 family endonuclease
MATATTPMTTEELLALPDNGMERWLIAGELRERPMTRRNRFHGRVAAVVTAELEIWRRAQQPPRGQVFTGDTGVRLRRDPDTVFGVDIMYVSPEVMARQTAEVTIIDGIPTLVVEVLSPNTTIEDLNEKIDAYLEAGVPLVWIIDPYRRTVTTLQPGDEPALFNVRQELAGEPHLPGFRVPVARLFD